MIFAQAGSFIAFACHDEWADAAFRGAAADEGDDLLLAAVSGLGPGPNAGKTTSPTARPLPRPGSRAK